MKFKKIFAFAAAALASVFVFTSCTGPNSAKGITATFEYNYKDAPAAYTQTIGADGIVTPPSDPERENYKFLGWYNEATCDTKADFDYVITSDVSYYAGWEQTFAVFRYNSNYEGGKIETVKVPIGTKASQPQEPLREGYVFNGWYMDSACSVGYDFASEVTADKELFAGWEVKSSNSCKVTFENNYPDGGSYYSQTVNKGRRVARPADPTRNGYAFYGWYTDSACSVGNEYNFNGLVQTDINLYAKWNKINIFEAEYVSLKGMVGVGWSSSVIETGMIDSDSTASNGFFVGYMYVTNNKLVFKVIADEATSDCMLALRLSGEGEEGSVISLNDEELKITVNGAKVNYSGIVLDNIPDINGGTRRPFSDFTIANVSLNKGENVIELIVNNNKSMGGTMNATAPMFDCLYLNTNVNVNWKEGECHTENIFGLKD